MLNKIYGNDIWRGCSKKIMINTAVITAGGEGSRMKKSGINIPKPLVKVKNKMLICYIIDSLIENNISKIIIIEPFECSLKKYLCDIYKNVELIFVHPPKKQKLFYNMLLIEDYIDGEFILSDADIIINKNILNQFIKETSKKSNYCSIATVKTPTIQNNHYLSIENERIYCFNKNGSVNGYHGGYLYALSDGIFEYIRNAIARNDLSFSNLITYISAKEKVIPAYVDDLWDVDDYSDIIETEKYLN